MDYKKLIIRTFFSSILVLFFVSDLNANSNTIKEYGLNHQPFKHLLESIKPQPRKSKSWSTYTQTYGKEKVQIKFPKTPFVKIDDNVVMTYYTRKKLLYSLITSVPPVENIDHDSAFALTIANLMQYPNSLIGYKTLEKDGNHILDTTSHDIDKNVVTRSRLIITEKNFYILRTIFPPGATEEHDFFINSFFIIE